MEQGAKEKLSAFIDMGESDAGQGPAWWALVSVLKRGLALQRDPQCFIADCFAQSKKNANSYRSGTGMAQKIDMLQI
jgi:hypothetical protein